jgi:hypothetical protein
MQVTIEGIEQFMQLDGRTEVLNSIRIRLPDGSMFAAQVEAQVIERILMLSREEPAVEESTELKPPAPSNGLSEDGVFGEGPVEVAQEDQLIDWTTLPDSTLPAAIKKALREANFHRVLRAAELAAVVDAITEEMRSKARQAAAVPAPLQQVARPRTVAKDELGYPIVPNKPSDPGEVALLGDEDGVQQL